MAAVEFQAVDILFGADPGAIAEATRRMDAGGTREDILAATGVIVGVSRASLKVRAGEICVLMGLSGSGKSTLLRAVNGLNKISRGKVLVADGERQVDIAACDAKTLRRMRTTRIAMVFQQFALLPWRTVRENVGLGLELRGMKPAERRRIVDGKLKLVALDRWADKYASELSGGMQQRVGLARAFATDADILLMDEPFSALDPLIRTRLQDELLDLQRNLKKTIIFVSHDLDEALKLGNQIAILEGGRIVQAGTPEDIVLRPADDYVREFVRHMNPLNILRAGGLATAIGDLPRIEGDVVLDAGRGLHLALDGAGQALAARLAGAACPLWPHAAGELPPAGALVLAPPDLLLREVVELRRASGLPVVLAADGRVSALCREDDLFGALAGDGWRA
ncbi:choline ABC transporter ATP-binding protein [Zavarzinia compransoris]|uniref:Trimethylamine N-oxide transport system ATP-binding protein TmoW n=1 Tax=Zavarzinia compransoris TaxID=1264899 RepID=A0A317DUE0_9PROT|nr:choline ABC transporter ATP-binding protein [Zavarzinia compransoris]PWR18004.1 choline ABC transporter ATP-binding protein [Zavarzinia compransoris]TDP43532.1 glycine betaine/proline transport system ATP-binding protein [Zavarzinia compransoris]